MLPLNVVISREVYCMSKSMQKPQYFWFVPSVPENTYFKAAVTLCVFVNNEDVLGVIHVHIFLATQGI